MEFSAGNVKRIYKKLIMKLENIIIQLAFLFAILICLSLFFFICRNISLVTYEQRKIAVPTSTKILGSGLIRIKTLSPYRDFRWSQKGKIHTHTTSGLEWVFQFKIKWTKIILVWWMYLDPSNIWFQSVFETKKYSDIEWSWSQILVLCLKL